MVALSQPTTVLLVEDQDQLRALARRILERHGFHVLPAAGGEDALTTLEQHDKEVNILLSDVVMPGVDGIQLAQKVRSRFPNVKIILMSGYGPEGLTSAGADRVMDELLLKPFTSETLIAAVRHVELS